MSNRNRNVLLIIVLALIAVFIFDRNVFLSLLSQTLYVVQLAFFVTATLWLLKHW